MLADRVRRAVRRRRPPSSMSVVVTLGPRQSRHFTECLDSLSAQKKPATEVLIAPWGGEAAEQHGDGLLPDSLTANDARNLGAAEATGELVLFLEAAEALAPRALVTLAGACVGGVEVVAGPEGVLASRLWRSTAVPRFDSRHGRFPHAALTAAADAVVPGPVVKKTGRGWATPLNQVPPAAAELDEFSQLLADLCELDAPASMVEVLSEVLPDFLDDLEHAPAAGRERFAVVLGRSFQSLPHDQMLAVPVGNRIRGWLVSEGRQEQMSRLAAEELRPRGHWITAVSDGRVRAVGDFDGIQIPDEWREIRADLTASLRSLRLVGERVRLGIFAGVRWIDSLEHPPALSGRMVHEETGETHDVEVVPRREDWASDRYFAQRHQSHLNSSFEVSFDASALRRPGSWRLELQVVSGGVTATGPVLDWDPHSSAGALDAGPGLRAVIDRSSGLRFVASEPSQPPDPSSVDPRLSEIDLGATMRLHGTSGHPFTLELIHPEWRIPVDVAWDEGEFTVEVTLRYDPWGFGARALPVGRWRLKWSTPDSSGDVLLSPALVALTPREALTAEHRISLMRGVRNQVLIQLAAPLADDERSVWAQSSMRSRCLNSSSQVDPGLAVFVSYAGTNTTDSPRSIYEDLRRRRPELGYRWMVATAGTPVPEGAQPLLMRSQEWYDALATARLIVTNIEMDPFFRRRPGQTVVQTFHGYPSKSMGLHEWRAKNFPPMAIEEKLRGTAGNWSVALTPTRAMDRHYREQYDYDGPILNRGYPRDDVLVNDQSAELRGLARERLGLTPEQTAILYAPTWREEEATGIRSAKLSNLLDIEECVAGLNDDHVLLLRGHRFHPSSREGVARVLDVSSYPEINDLILAADVAVLDYSSLRFDFALTRKPMVFLVPDLGHYADEGRGFLFPFTDSAPGPLLSSTREVVEAVRDLPSLTESYADEIEAFNATYHADQDGCATSRVVDWIESDLVE
ncbi:MAG: CDP-glycerol glycerophosphotransferase family protein [Nocardioides sp.]|nr:CDP-glycerol glycerophosphotransferase family protein [Nocardioides sp.]